jgi:phosphoglycolate phosphatase-like HAD superfamily hydrolase
MTNLAIFDMDGTLTNSNKVDAACYVRSIIEEFGIENVDDSWETYKNVTDPGVFDEIFENAFSREPSETETQRFLKRFLDMLEECRERDPALFAEIAGAGDILKMLRKHPEWEIGIATGAWRESALFKFESAGIAIEGIPFVTGSDEKSREGILRKCIGAAKDHYRVGDFERIVSIGDAVWDLRTAANMKIPFIGINKPEKFQALSECKILRDYSDSEKFMRYLEEATVPVIRK